LAEVSIVIPTYKGMPIDANAPMIAMMQATNCFCHNERTGMRLHDPWKCPKGKHHVQMSPPVHASSVVHWARNWSVARAMYGNTRQDVPESDYFLLCDDDMVAEPGYLLRMLSYKLDIVCGICTIRRDPPIPNIRLWNSIEERFYYPIEWDWDSQKLMEIDAAGAAFMLVKRTVFEKMATAYLNCEFELEEDRRKMATVPGDLIDYWHRKSDMRKAHFEKSKEEKNWSAMDFWPFQFWGNFVDSQLGELGEDVTFCTKAKMLGFKIYADPQVLPGHLGVYSYSIRDYREHVEQMKSIGKLPETMKENVVGVGA
jgi:hypothetical protein